MSQIIRLNNLRLINSQVNTITRSVAFRGGYQQLNTFNRQFELYRFQSNQPNDKAVAQEPKRGKIMEFYHKAKELAIFYKNGMKQILVNRKEAKLILERKAKGEDISRREFRLINTAQSDFNKLIPFSILVFILPESIPFLVIFAPSTIPSTCVTQEQQLKKMKKLDDKRDEMITSFNKSVKEFHEISNKDFSSLDKTLALMKRTSNQLDIDLVEKPALANFTKFMGLATWGPKSWIQLRLLKYLNYIKQDDNYLANMNLKDLTHFELQVANWERGMRSNGTSEELEKSLKTWIDLHLHTSPTTPPIFMVFSRLYIWNIHFRN
ncbi:hypothetical protein CONCODRAFT_80231 [Conidiobolus coronatus NRRL 28638]|uniref:Letm1 RBD domain-containing protein n=1 Tax=Conidiobolus coronatus (strain ATCC 28846 / CBS 209.66 / NRRL 28638) TaxID=796925 RepID=A0A137NWZ0_CONC2|nr:hypothetical protein CONCODRAFT_80231 [Conidiobolus coronatus NRRL 28638]|eukprot:KXN67262.1 hypothetical protein CONCODRAFT_80231 [Conidiobolus coronatus NRRL 28638]